MCVTSVTYNYASGTVALAWQGSSAVRHAQRTGTTWSSVSTVVAGATPNLSIGVPGNLQNTSEVLLSRGNAGAPYAVQRTTISYGARQEEDRLASKGKEISGGFGPGGDSNAVEGRGGYIAFANGSIHIAVLSAAIDGQVLRFPPLSDSLRVLRRQQIDSAATTLPHPGVGMLELTVLYRVTGEIPAAAQFGLELRDANSGAQLRKLRAFKYEGDTVATLRYPLNYPGRLVTIGFVGTGMNAASRFTLERWLMPMEEGNTSLAGLQRAGVAAELPTSFALYQNFPDPFNPSTTIKFDLPEPSQVSLIVYDVLGKKVVELANGYRAAGRHSMTWNASEVASGVYFARFSAADGSGNVKLSSVSKLLLAK